MICDPLRKSKAGFVIEKLLIIDTLADILSFNIISRNTTIHSLYLDFYTGIIGLED